MMTSYHLNDDGCQRALSRAHNDLVANINVDEALAFLAGFLKKEDVCDIKNLFTPEAKCRVLMRRIGKGGVKTYRKFKEYLVRYNSDVLKTLEKHEGELTLELPENEIVNSNTKITDINLARIALRVHRKFDLTSANLRIAENIVDQIKKDYSYSHYEQVYQFLREWKEQKKSDATYGFLISQLQKCPGLWSLKLSDFGRQTIEDDADERNFQDIRRDITIEMKKDLYDGWLIYLQKDFIDYLRKQSETVIEGEFAKVFVTDRKIDAFGTRLAIKQITKRSVYRTSIDALIIKEKYVAKILHFAIVPLIAHHEDKFKNEYYLISPYLEKGDLFDAIKYDTRNEGRTPKLNMDSRMKIIYQISCAIEFIHRGTQDRKPLLHLDIKSNNIVLDAKLNARLTDFGNAIELKDDEDFVSVEVQVNGTQGYSPMVTMEFSRKHDYHGIGVVMRELITGQEAVLDKGKQLRNLNKDDVIKLIQRHIWTDEVAKKLVDLSVTCLNYEQTKTMEDEISTQTAVLLRKNSVTYWSPNTDGRCERCLVNPALNKDILRMNHSSCDYALCCTCLRNSHVNPIVCHTCKTEIKPFIGDGVGALLVAGYDECNTFVEDIRQFAIVATSRVVPSMCIRESNLKMITPNATETSDGIQTKILKALEKLVTETGIHTLLFYYSGHNKDNDTYDDEDYATDMDKDKETDNKANCLQITNTCSFDLTLLGKKLCQLNKENTKVNIKKTIVFLDCCYPKFVDMSTEKMIQINVCTQNNEATCKKGDSSFFTKCVIQALTMKAMVATELKCTLSKCDSSCVIQDDFISVERLVEFIRYHADNQKSKLPIVDSRNVSSNDIYLAYNYHFPVQFEFKVQMKQFGNTTQLESKCHVNVGLPDCLDLGRLKTRLRKEYLEYLAITSTPNACESLSLDMFCIECKQARDDVQEIEDVNELPRKHCLTFKLRDIGHININKPVAMFVKNVTLISKQDQKAIKLSSLEDDAFNEKHQHYYERCWNEALSIIEKRMEVDLEIPKESLQKKFKTLRDDGAGFVTFAIVLNGC